MADPVITPAASGSDLLPMPTGTGAVIPAASGYRGQTGNFPAIYEGRPILFFYGATVAGRITTQNTVGSVIRHTGEKVVFWRSATASVHSYTKGQELQNDTIAAPTIELHINLAYYAAMAVDVIDKQQNALFGELLNSWQIDALQKMAQISDVDTFATMELQSGVLNKGSCAGASTFDIDLGAAGAPVLLTKDNILDVLQDCNSVLLEANAPGAGLFVVLPIRANALVMTSPVTTAAMVSGEDRSSYLRGASEVKGPLSGFDAVLMSNYLQRRYDPIAKRYCYAVPFGPDDATAYIAQTNLFQAVPVRPNDFGQSARMLQDYGIKVLTPEVMGTLYCSLPTAEEQKATRTQVAQKIAF